MRKGLTGGSAYVTRFEGTVNVMRVRPQHKEKHVGTEDE